MVSLILSNSTERIDPANIKAKNINALKIPTFITIVNGFIVLERIISIRYTIKLIDVA